MKTSEPGMAEGWRAAAMAVCLTGIVAGAGAAAQEPARVQAAKAQEPARVQAATADGIEDAADAPAPAADTPGDAAAEGGSGNRAAPLAQGPAARGSRELALRTTSVSGNRELPRVMVVVPWKTAAPAELGGRPIVSLVEEALTPVDPEVFQRRLEYYALLHGEAAKEAGELATTASNLTEE